VDKNISARLRSALAMWVASYPENPNWTSSLERFSINWLLITLILAMLRIALTFLSFSKSGV
jgi:hypothetical protein